MSNFLLISWINKQELISGAGLLLMAEVCNCVSIILMKYLINWMADTSDGIWTGIGLASLSITSLGFSAVFLKHQYMHGGLHALNMKKMLSGLLGAKLLRLSQ